MQVGGVSMDGRQDACFSEPTKTENRASAIGIYEEVTPATKDHPYPTLKHSVGPKAIIIE